MLILAITPEGEQCEIRLKQRVDTSDANLGRLLFNNHLIPVRSEEEAQIIRLLKNAATSQEKFEVPGTIEIRIIKNEIVRGAEINKYLNKPVSDEQRNFCDQMIAYVESGEYVQIAQQKNSQMLQRP